jgi:NADH-quinone oxidoreductase subunit E
MSIAFDDQSEARFQRILADFPEGTSRIMPALHLAQEAFGAITPEVERYLADRLELPQTRLREVVTFYHMFRRHPHGRYTITVCDNISCRLAGADELIAHLRRKLQVGDNGRSADGRFTLETTVCIGACHQAPAFQIEGCFYGPLSLEQVDRLLEELCGEDEGQPR